MRRSVIVWLACCMGVNGLRADGPLGKPAADHQDFVFLGPEQPIRIRARIRIDGQSHRDSWDAFLRRLFQHLDRNGDGSLDKVEAESAPRAQALRELLRVGNVTTAAGRPTMSQMDGAPTDGKVTQEEFRKYYRRFGLTALQSNYLRVSPGGNNLTQALFRILDADGDGNISPDEAGNAARVLGRLDIDDDEMIRPREITPNVVIRPPPDPNTGMMAAAGQDFAYLPDDGIFVAATQGEYPPPIVDQLLKRYDKNADGKLSLPELGIPETSFLQLDKNKDGNLDADELAQFVDLEPQFELFLGFFAGAPPLRPIDLFQPARPLAALRQSLSPRHSFRAVVKEAAGVSGEMAIEPQSSSAFLVRAPLGCLDVRSQALAGAGPEMWSSIAKQFEDADSNKNGAVEAGEGQGMQFQLLQAVLRAADRNGDGKISLAEFNALLEILAMGAGRSVQVSVVDFDRGLFDLLDVNHDGLLSQREMRQVAERLTPYRRKADGKLTMDRVPMMVQLFLDQGRPAATNAGLDGLLTFGMTKPIGGDGGPAPLWFQRMDRNGDQDVSQREFLGTAAVFRSLDKNGDGLLDVEEARQAEKLFKRQ